jgi:xylulose-5-phosphate/fructose-6-phosphate phosphoketolase
MDAIPTRALAAKDVEVKSISPYGIARSTVSEKPLDAEEIRKYDAWFKASMYLCLGMLYLRENPLLKAPLKVEHLKARLLGHWGSDAGQAFTWMHFNRLIKKYDLNALFVSGPGHGAPAVLSQSYLEGVYSEVYPYMSESEESDPMLHPRPQVRSTKVVNSDTLFPTLSVPFSTTRA